MKPVQNGLGKFISVLNLAESGALLFHRFYSCNIKFTIRKKGYRHCCAQEVVREICRLRS